MAGTDLRAAYILRACPWKMSPSGGLVWTRTRPTPRRPATCPSDLADTWLVPWWWTLSACRTPSMVRRMGHSSAGRRNRSELVEGNLGKDWSDLVFRSRLPWVSPLSGPHCWSAWSVPGHLMMPGWFVQCGGARCTSLYEKLL